MKKTILLFVLISITLLANLEDLIIPRSRRKGEPGYGNFPFEEITTRKKIKQRINGYSISMPENMIFKLGTEAAGRNRMFGKRRKYLYDTKTKLSTSIYLIEDVVENLQKYKGNDHIKDKDIRGRYYVDVYNSSNSVLIPIKNNLQIICDNDWKSEYGTFNANKSCEDLVKVMKE